MLEPSEVSDLSIIECLFSESNRLKRFIELLLELVSQSQSTALSQAKKFRTCMHVIPRLQGDGGLALPAMFPHARPPNPPDFAALSELCDKIKEASQ